MNGDCHAKRMLRDRGLEAILKQIGDVAEGRGQDVSFADSVKSTHHGPANPGVVSTSPQGARRRRPTENAERTDEQLSGDIPERCMKNRSGSPKEASGGAPPG